MSQIRYYTDEHVAAAVIRGLRQRGIDVLSVPDAGTRAQLTKAILLWHPHRGVYFSPKTLIFYASLLTAPHTLE